MKILIIEGEKILAEVLSEKFQKAQFTSKIAGDGEEAMILSKSFKPDIIVLDLMLPKLDGFGYLKQIKSNEELKMIPVVIMSNLSEDENIKRGLQLGAIDYFVKANHPINEIVEKIKNVLLKSR